MKRLKKWTAMVLAVILMMSMSVAAMAAGENHTITINNSVSGHSYAAYQIFKGDLADDGTLSNIEWGSGVNGADLLAALQAADSNTYGNCKNAADAANVLAANGTFNNSTAKAFAEIAANYTTNTSFSSNYSDGNHNYTIAGLEDGYYLIRDIAAVTGADAQTEYILTVTNDTEVTPKSDVPESQKKVKDANDTAGTVSEWQDSADYDIGDSIPFQLTATLPDNYSEYDTYSMTFHDTEANGLDFQSDTVKVYVGDNTTPIDSTLYNIQENTTDKCTFEITIPDVKNIQGVTDSSVIRVEYESVLNDQAVIGSAGNKNNMYLTYSNNPYGEGTGEGTGTTPEDTVIVFTYQTIINKKDENNGELTGATFTLEKEIKGETGNSWKKIDEITGINTSVFTFTGLDDGNYRLTETKAPDRYNTMEPVLFTVTATHDTDTDSDGVHNLSALTGTVENGVIQFTPDVTKGSLTANIQNFPGSILPGTGGMGTTVFYIVGIALVAGAAAIITVRIKKARR